MTKDTRPMFQTDSDTNFLKLYYLNAKSKTKIYPYYVKFINLSQAQQAESLLNSLGFEKVVVPGAKSYDLCVNLELKRYSNPHVAYWYIGCKEIVDFEKLKLLLHNDLSNDYNP